MPMHYVGDEVVIDCYQTSQLDGKKGVVKGFDRGYVVVLVQTFFHPMLFSAGELKR